MSRCAQTDGLLEVLFTDRDLSRAQAAHVGSCVVCARAIGEVRLFERELWRTGSELTEDALPSADGLVDSAGRPNLEGGSMTSLRDLAASVGIAVALVLVIFAGGAWLGSQFSDRITAGAVAPEVVDAWAEVARAHAVQEAARFGPPDPAVWEVVQLELCGDTAIAFYSDSNRGAGYVWAIGHPQDPASAVLDTGSAARIEDSGVAALRAMLPICEMVRTDPGAPSVVLDAPIEPQTVSFSPSFHWLGPPADAPVTVEGAAVREVGLRLGASLQGTVDDPSIRAVDIITGSGRLRYPASIPGFAVETNLEGAGLRFEFRDGQGNVVAAGPVVELDDADRRRALEAGRRADLLALAERRALEDGHVGARCAEWPALTDLEQMAIAAVVIADLERVRIVQELPPGTSLPEILASARVSIGKACEGSPEDRAVADVARALYGED